MMHDDPKKSDGSIPGGITDNPGNRSGSGADTAFKEMLKKRQMSQHGDGDSSGSEDDGDAARSQT